MPTINLHISVPDDQQELLMAILLDTDPLGFEQKSGELIASYSKENFPESQVEQALATWQYSKEELPDQNWNQQWESSFEPVIVEGFCAVRAAFHKPVEGVEHELIITPKMSFGTGHHATTWMMIKQMRDLDFRGKTVFDFGTGTGILAILAMMLGAEKADATDIDSWCIENTQENVQANGVSNVNVWLSPEVPEKKYDIILANINRNVLDVNADQLKAALNPGGHLLLSGIMPQDESMIRERFEQTGLRHQNSLERSNWISMLLTA